MCIVLLMLLGNSGLSALPFPEANSRLDLAILSEQTRKQTTHLSSSDVKLDCAIQRQHKTATGAQVVPECQSQNPALYKPVQCLEPKQCFCVDEYSGEPVLNTYDRPGGPNCRLETLTEVPARKKEKEKPGKHVFKNCKGRRKAKFFTRLLSALKTELIMSGESGNVTAERVLRWKFEHLDANRSKNIERSEWKPYKELIKGWRRVKTCSRNFFRFCDLNANRRVSLDEWKTCTEPAAAAIVPRRLNPFLYILKPA